MDTRREIYQTDSINHLVNSWLLTSQMKQYNTHGVTTIYIFDSSFRVGVLQDISDTIQSVHFVQQKITYNLLRITRS